MKSAVQQADIKRLHQLSVTKRFLQSQNALMTIVGEMASGKSELLAEIVFQMRQSRHVIRMQGTPNLNPSHLVNTLSKDIAIPKTEESQRLETRLDAMLNEITKHQRACVLVIDDAHLLSLSALAAIAHLVTQQDGKRTYLHILLSGRPGLTEKISSLLTKDIQRLTVGALSREASFRKIKHLIDDAGLHLPHAAANAIFTKIYRDSEGMPQTLESMVKKLLVERTASEPVLHIAPTQKIKPASANRWQANRVKIISLVLLAGLSYLFWGFQHHHFHSTHHTIQAAKPTLPAKPAQTMTANIIAPAAKPVPKPVAADIPKQKPLYTLQLMSGMNPQAMTHFVQRHHLGAKAAVMKTKYKGHDWYVLTWGRFNNSIEANAAIASLPKYLKNRHPWARSTQNLATSSKTFSRPN